MGGAAQLRVVEDAELGGEDLRPDLWQQHRQLLGAVLVHPQGLVVDGDGGGLLGGAPQLLIQLGVDGVNFRRLEALLIKPAASTA